MTADRSPQQANPVTRQVDVPGEVLPPVPELSTRYSWIPPDAPGSSAWAIARPVYQEGKMMLRRKVAILVSALVLAVASGTAAGASARSVILPWWQQTVYALGPNDSYVAEWMGSSWISINLMSN